MKRWIFLLLAVLLLTACGDIRKNPAATAVTEPAKTYQVTYHWYIDTVYIPEDLRKELDRFGSLRYVEPVADDVQTYNQIPKVENDAKGADPVCIVMPELDLSVYDGAYIWDDSQTGLNVSAYYRTVAGMLTDELVKVYVDDAGSIQHYETVNLGKYDALALDEKQVERWQQSMRIEIRSALREVRQEVYPDYHLFTDVEGNLVICVTAVLKNDGGNVELYALVKDVASQFYETE